MVVLVRGSPRACEERLLKEFICKYREDQFSTFLIVPTQALARQLTSKMMGEFDTFDKNSIITMDGLAKARMASSPNARFLINQFASEAIIRNLMSARKADLPLFTVDDEIRQGLVPEVRAFISTTLDFKVQYPDALGSEMTPKIQQLTLIRDSYLKSIHDRGYIDQHELLSWASRDMLETKQTGMKNLFFYGIKEPKPIERDFISTLCSLCPKSTYYLIFSDDNPAFQEDLDWLDPALVEDLPESERDRSLSAIFCCKGESQNVEVHIGEYTDSRAEMRAVCSEIRGLLDGGVEPDRIAVLLPMRRKTGALAREIMDDFQIPANVRVPVSFSESAIAQTILRIVDVAANDFRADDMAEVLASPCIRFRFKYEGEDINLSVSDFKRLSKDLGVVLGKDNWIEAVGKDRDGDNGSDISPAKAGLIEFIRVFDTFHGEKKAVDHIKALRHACERLEFGKRMYMQDEAVLRRNKRALKNYWDMLKDLEIAARNFSGEKINLTTFATLHRGLVTSEEFYPDPNIEKTVKVMGIRAAQLMEFDHVFIPGMVENDIPRIKVLNPFVPEAEVEALGLLTRTDILRQERYYFLTALLSSEGRIYLSWHRTEADKPVLRSMFLDAVEAAICCSPSPEECLGRSREGSQWLVGNAIRGAGVQLSSRPYGLDISQCCQAINIEEFKRDGPYRTEFDGVLTGEPVLVDISKFHDGRVYSAKQLNMYMWCPYRYYLTYHLGMSPEVDREEADPANTGKFVHRVLHRFYQERHSSNRLKITDAERDRAISSLRNIAVDEGRNGSSLTWKAYINHFIGSGQSGVATVFVDHELKNKLPSMNPRWLELAFGVRDDGSDSDTPRGPVSIPLNEDGEFMRLACRIDRVDVDLQGLFFVLDYKTGRPLDKCKATGDVQIPLYIMALEAAMPGSTGIGGGFYYIGGRKNTRIVSTVRDRNYANLCVGLGKLHIKEWDRERLDGFRTDTLPRWLNDMREGRFHLSKSGNMSITLKCGPSCEFFGACRFDKARTLEMGLEHNDDEDEDGDQE